MLPIHPPATFGLTSGTIARSIDSIVHNGYIKEGADHRNDNCFKYLYAIIIGWFTDKPEAAIKAKEDFLVTHTKDISLAIINARANGNFECRFSLEMDANTKKHFKIFQADNSSDIKVAELDGPEGNVIEEKIIHGVTYQQLQKAALTQYLTEQRARYGNATIDLSDFDLATINLSDIDFKRAKLSQQNLSAFSLGKGNLTGALLADGINFSDISFKDVKLDRNMLATLVRCKANLRGIDVSNQNLSDQSLQGLDFTGANFANAILKNANFHSAILTDANFQSVDAQEACFVEANLSTIIVDNKANFMKSDMRLATIGNVLGTIMPEKRTGINLSITQIIDAHRQGYSLREGQLYGRTNIVTNDFSQQNWSTYDFSNTDLGNTNFSNADLTNAKFTNAQMFSVRMDENTKVAGTDFTNANFTGGDLRAVVIGDGTVIKGISVSNAKLNRSWVEAAIKQGVSLKGANLEGINLSGLDLSGVDLTGVKLQGADLKGTKLNKLGLIAAIKSREIIDENSKRVGVDLKGIDVSGTDNSRVTLSEINFNDADLTGAKFDHCDIVMSSFNRSNLTDVNFNDTKFTICTAVDSTVSAENRQPFVDQLRNRLQFITSGVKSGNDLFELAPDTERVSLRNTMFFRITELTLKYADTDSEHGAQQIILNNQLREAHITTPVDDKSYSTVIKETSHKLLGEGFSDQQKIIFHWARSTMWSAIKFAEAIAEWDPAAENDPTQSIISTGNFKTQVYLRNDKDGRSMTEEALKLCFDTALTEFKTVYPDSPISDDEIDAVKELFLSKNHAW